MHKKEKEILARHVSMRVGGEARAYWTPDSEDQLIADIRGLLDSGEKHCVLGKGSNTIFMDEGYDGVVLSTTRACKELSLESKSGIWKWKKGTVYAGCSVTNQQFIRFCMQSNLAAPYYLNSVPGNIGGAVFMNAGTGVQTGKYISDFITRVKIFDGNEVLWLPKESCGFAFRKSTFQSKKWLILGAAFEMPAFSGEHTKALVDERMAIVKETQDSSFPNAGSVFKEGYKAVDGIMGKSIGKAQFSEKTHNWIINNGGAAAKDVLDLVDWAQKSIVSEGHEKPVREWVVHQG